MPASAQITFRGFPEMTMGHVEFYGQSYTRTYLREMIVNADKLYVPQEGAGY